MKNGRTGGLAGTMVRASRIPGRVLVLSMFGFAENPTPAKIRGVENSPNTCMRRSLRKNWRIIVKNELKTINQQGRLRPFKGCL